MSDEKSNQEEREDEDLFGEEQETENSNDSEGDDSEGASESDSSESALKEYNERTGKNFKTWDDVVKSTKEADKRFAQGEHKKETASQEAKQPQTQAPQSSAVLQSLYFNANPEAEGIWEEVESEATKLGKDPYELYESSSYLKGEARARAEAKKAEEEAKSKVEKPSNGVASKKSEDLSKVKAEDVASLTPKQTAEWVKLQAAKEEMDAD